MSADNLARLNRAWLDAIEARAANDAEVDAELARIRDEADACYEASPRPRWLGNSAADALYALAIVAMCAGIGSAAAVVSR